MFIDLAKYLRDTPHAYLPKLVVLENVLGLVARGKNGSPIDFVMSGLMRENGKTQKIGLSFNTNYHVMQPVKLTSKQLGLPMRRARVFIIMVRRDMLSSVQCQNIQANIKLAEANPIETASIDSLLDDADVEEERDRCGQKKARLSMRPKSSQQAALFRLENDLPPFSRRRVVAWLDENPDKFTLRELEVLDTALLLSERAKGAVPPELVVDVSQGVSRGAFKHDGCVMSFHKGMRLLHKGKLLGVTSCFNLMGWPKNEVIIPEDLSSKAAVWDMLGNMVATPVIGIVLACCLWEIVF